MKILIYAFGSRGDVQPCVAIGRELKVRGHAVTILATAEFEGFVTGYGLDFHSAGFSIKEKITNNPQFDKALSGEANYIPVVLSEFRRLQEDFKRMLDEIADAGEGAEAVVFSTLGLGGYHLAEALDVPAIWSLTMPIFTPTADFPNPIIPRLPFKGRITNRFTHWLSDAIWKGFMNGAFNRWRKECLGLKPRRFEGIYYREFRGKPTPRLYHFSRQLLPKPDSWDEAAHITGYAFLDAADDWEPPGDLTSFLESGPAPVYAGFGSMPDPRKEEFMAILLEALAKSGDRCVLHRGWADLGGDDLPDTVCLVDSIPHSWLFPRMRAVIHHCGAGTTAAGLRAGVPVIPVPFAGDQPFWADRMRERGAATEMILRKDLTVEKLANALEETRSQALVNGTAKLGDLIRAEDGVKRSADLIEGYINTPT